MKAKVKKEFVGYNREFKTGETVDLTDDQIKKLNKAGLGMLVEPIKQKAAASKA